jgi:hypothetical protein
MRRADTIQAAFDQLQTEARRSFDNPTGLPHGLAASHPLKPATLSQPLKRKAFVYGKGFAATFLLAVTSYGGGTRAQITTATSPITNSGVGD